jgi:AcrR family transcriptional regulator
MARQKSADKRQAILSAAITQIAKEGLGAATASIAKEAAVANGSFFTYFETKQELFNQLYRELKLELIAVVREEWPDASELRTRFRHNWMRWTKWGADFPEKRRALAQLSVSDLVTDETRASGIWEAEFTLDVIREISRKGALKGQPPAFVFSIVETLAGATMDFMIRDPKHAASLQASGFEAAWKAIS